MDPAVHAVTAPGLARERLHGSVADPVLSTMGFLNEVMARYPDAVSFAPGAVHESFFDTVDPARYLDRYAAHLRDRGLDAAAIRRELYQYGPAQGRINGLIAEALRRDQGLDIPASSIVVTVGAQEAMLLILRALCTAGRDAVGVVDPCYVGISGAARLLDLDLVPVAEGDRLGARVAVAAATARAHGRRLAVLYVAPDYANPSGTLLSVADRHGLLDVADREDILIIEDGAYAFTAPPGAGLPSLKALDCRARVIGIGTLAKIGLPGLRIGYVVAGQQVTDGYGVSRPLAAELAAVKSMVTVNTSPVCQAIAAGMLLEHGGSLATLAAGKAAFYRRNLGLLRAALDRHLGGVPGVSWTRPDGGFFVRLRLPVPATENLLEWCAREYGVLWTPMSYFHAGPGGRHEARLSCSYLDPIQIDEGVRRLARFARACIGAAARKEPVPCA